MNYSSHLHYFSTNKLGEYICHTLVINKISFGICNLIKEKLLQITGNPGNLCVCQCTALLECQKRVFPRSINIQLCS